MKDRSKEEIEYAHAIAWHHFNEYLDSGVPEHINALDHSGRKWLHYKLVECVYEGMYYAASKRETCDN